MAVPPLLNSEWAPSPRVTSLSSTVASALPFASTVKFPQYRRSGGLRICSNPCFFAVRIEMRPADLSRGHRTSGSDENDGVLARAEDHEGEAEADARTVGHDDDRAYIFA